MDGGGNEHTCVKKNVKNEHHNAQQHIVCHVWIPVQNFNQKLSDGRGFEPHRRYQCLLSSVDRASVSLLLDKITDETSIHLAERTILFFFALTN